jgi:hypothetical protein
MARRSAPRRKRCVVKLCRSECAVAVSCMVGDIHFLIVSPEKHELHPAVDRWRPTVPITTKLLFGVAYVAAIALLTVVIRTIS